MSGAVGRCPGPCTCGCCEGATDRTPRAVENRPGLDAIAYRTGTHGEFLASMVAGLTAAGRPRLRELTTRDPDDVTIGLLDAWAVTSDVLTFYTERLAQESYLRTARDRASLQELGRLIGYRLRPGVAAETVLVFAVEPPPEPPPSAPGTAGEPGALPPVTPPVVAVPVGLRVQSIPAPGQQPQTFETVEPLDARPAWGAIPASTTVVGVDATEAWLAGTSTALKPGDLLLWTVGDVSEARYLTVVAPEPAGDRTRVAWRDPLTTFGPGSSPTPIAFRRQVAVFGHNAPSWKAMSLDFRTNYVDGGADLDEWPDLDVALEPALASLELDGSHPEVVVGSTIVIRVGSSLATWTVTACSEASDAAFAVSGRVTFVDGDGPTSLGSPSRREVVVHAASEQLALARRDDTSVVEGTGVEVDRDVGDLEPDRRIVVVGLDGAGNPVTHVTTVASVDEGGGRWVIGLTDALPEPLVRASVVVHANATLATHGETVGELLGSGRAGATHQRFTLRSEPLTQVQSSDPSGATAALEVRVNDVRWAEVATLYGAGATDRTYVLRTDEADHRFVQFGDGEHGSRLPTGDQNVRARYRKGLGAAGNVGPGQLANLLDRPLGLKGVSNPAAATGGTDPEPATAARRSIPLAVRTLGRAVSVLDYEDFARTFAGVSEARADVLALRSGPTVVVTVAFGELGLDPVGGRLEDLARTFADHGDPHAAAEVLDHVQIPFRLAMKVAVDPTYESAAVLAGVDAAVRAAFAFPARRFGATVEQSQVIAVVHRVAGVVAVDLDLLYTGTSATLQARLVAPSATVTAAGTASPATVLVLAASPFDWLEVLP